MALQNPIFIGTLTQCASIIGRACIRFLGISALELIKDTEGKSVSTQSRQGINLCVEDTNVEGIFRTVLWGHGKIRTLLVFVNPDAHVKHLRYSLNSKGLNIVQTLAVLIFSGFSAIPINVRKLNLHNNNHSVSSEC